MRTKVWVTIAALAAVLAAGSLLFVWYFQQAVPTELGKPTITGRVIENISEPSMKELYEFVKREDKIVGASVVQVDLIKNRRQTIHLKADDPKLQEAWDEYISNRVPPPPVFNAQEPVQNNQVADLFNGNFVCLRFEDTVNFKYWPKGAAHAPWICSSPIPPSFDGSGDFTGFINLFFKSEPTGADRERIMKAVSDISRNIYKRDVDQTAK